MATKVLQATCLCKSAVHSLTISAPALPLNLTFCHCNSCRHMTGTLCLTVAVLPSSYAPSPDLLDKVTVYEFFERITAYFCSTCGTHMLFYVKHSGGDPRSSGYWAVHTGTLQERVDDILEADVHWFVADTLDGGFADFIPSVRDVSVPRYAGFKGKSTQLPLYWKSQEGPRATPAPCDRLHCRCRCDGVEFWVARPSERPKKASDHSARWLRDNGKKFLAGVCNCNSCRLATGMEWMEWASILTIDITLDAEGTLPFSVPFGTLKGYRSSRGVFRYHCDTCGASAFHRRDDRSDFVGVAVGLMDAPEGARAESWLEWTTTRLSHREGAVLRARGLTIAVERGLAEYRKEGPGVSQVAR